MARLSEADRKALSKALHAARRGESGASRALYARLRGLSAAEVIAVLDEVGAEYATALAKEITGQVLSAQRIGARAASDMALRTLRRDRLPAGLADRAATWLRRRITQASSYRVSPLTGRRTAYVSQEGTVWLSRALHGANARRGGVIDGLRGAITEAVRTGETATSLAQRLRDEVGHRVAIKDGGPPSVAIPTELREMERAALRSIRASGDPRVGPDLARTRAEFKRYVDRLQGGSLGTKSAARAALHDLESAIRRGSADAVDKAVKWWTWNKEQEHQRLIARTETARAYNRAYIEGSRAVPWVSGWTWVADGESCDLCEALDGTFIPRGDNGPFPPLHPNCDCYLLEEIDADMQPSPEQWEETLAAAAA